MAVMQVTAVLHEAHVETVLENTISIDKCSASTLKLLGALLGSEETVSDASEGIIITKSAQSRHKSSKVPGRSTKSSNARINAKFSVLDHTDAPILCLPRADRLTLATTTFNKTLKNLGDALRAKQALRCKNAGLLRSPLKETQGRNVNASKTTSKPVDDSGCPQPSSPELHKALKGPNSLPYDSPGLRATAGCARTSLQCLRKLKQCDNAMGEQAKRLEQGALVLISKLQGLGLINSAIKETLNVREALDKVLRTHENSSNDTEINRQLSYYSLVDCIGFAESVDDPRVVELITTFQGQVVQLVAFDEKSLLNLNLLQQLDPSNPRSPCGTILHGAARGYLSSEKAAVQLHLLSQSVLSICSLPSNGASEKHPSYNSANTNFEVQCIALQIRCHWWCFSHQQPDLDKEIWAPFYRAVISLGGKARQTTKAHFLLVKRWLDRLLQVTSETANFPSSNSRTVQPSSAILQALQHMAEASGSEKDSLDLLHSMEDSYGVPTGLPGATYCCRVASTTLHIGISAIENLTTTVETALEALKGPLKGTRTELEELLLQSSRLRKAAAIRLTAINESLRSTPLDDKDQRLSTICIKTIFEVLHFMVRYLSIKLPSGEVEGSTPNPLRERQYSALFAQQALKSALASVQSNITKQYVGWEFCVSALADCLSAHKLLNQNCDYVSGADNHLEDMPSVFVKVSNIFWSWYLKQKDVNASISDLVAILKKSIQALEGGTLAEKKRGFLVVKCEKTADLYLKLKQFDRAYQVLATAIRAHIEAGTLAITSERAITHSLLQAWGEADSSEFMLGRVLSTNARLILQYRPDPSSLPFFDDVELSPGQRALLLEQQFVALTENLVPEGLRRHMMSVAETVLSIYNDENYSLRRLRFISKTLTFCSKNHLLPHEFLPAEALKICNDGSSNVALLEESQGSSRAILSSLLLQWAFQKNVPSVNLLQAFLSSHTWAAESYDNWNSILCSINDPDLVMVQLQSVIDFADMRGLLRIKLDALLLMRRLLELRPEKDSSAIASCTSQLGAQYTRMGLTSQAGRALASAESLLAQSKSKTLIALQWHLAYAEYLTAIASYEKAAEQLASAQWRYETDFASDQENTCHSPSLAQHKYLAQAALVASNLAIENGDFEDAVLYAKQSVKVSMRQWSVLEKLLGVQLSSAKVERGDTKADGLIAGISKMTLSTVQQPQLSSSKAAGFWAYVQIHFDGLLHLSRLSAHQGSFQDAIYYGEQARKIGEAIGSDVLLHRAFSILAADLAQAGRMDRSQIMLDSCKNICENTDHAAALQTIMAKARAYLAKGEFASGFEAVEQAQKTVFEILANDNPNFLSRPQSKDLAKALPIKHPSRSRVQPATRARKPRNPTCRPASRSENTNSKDLITDEVKSAADSNVWFQRLRGEILLLKTSLCIRSGSCEEVCGLLEVVATLARSGASDAWYFVLRATVMLADALQLLQSDAVYSVLAESSIAYPTRQRIFTGEFGREQNAERGPTSNDVTQQAYSDNRTTKKKASSQSGLIKPKALISNARHLLLSSLLFSLPRSSLAIANELSSLLTRVQLLSSVLLPTMSSSSYQVTCHFNAPKSLRWSRETTSIAADVVLGDKSTLFRWPETPDYDKAALACERFKLDCAVLQEQLNENLPSSWNVVTVDISDDRSEILTSKIRQGQTPFLLRLPLERTTSEDMGEEPFTFQTAKSELDDIIASANLTAHDKRAGSDKQGKKLWWAAREALDGRLASLLQNMQTLWLGGFRGIFFNQPHDDELLSRFAESLSHTLGQYLPSRRKAGARLPPKVQLHPSVLELFIALGNPDDVDLHDAVTDLLYFVVDILQCQGEYNAYDEIDFDAIVVQVNDGLRSYHEAAKSICSEGESHTILILDNALHNFPWESLPCLEGRSVTRMPSLSCVQERLQRMKQNDEISPGLRIDPQKGAYILNPSSDLVSTEQTFLGPFDHTFVNYSSIVDRAPTEIEFEACLRDKDLCLYFGHGSGAQYIRGRTIKRLKQCAVTFLMGCSSSKMVECGKFESYGVPYNYLQGGSAAVVGTLWDVTDKDIDRFAMETFVNWGLLDRDVVKDDAKDRAKKMKRKGRTKNETADVGGKHVPERPGREVGLDEAVAQARHVCVLRYLNGSAPVVYGVPVYLRQ
jgi:separase